MTQGTCAVIAVVAVLACLGPLAKPSAAQTASPVGQGETLRGFAAIAIEVMTTADLQHMRSALEEDIQSRLRSLGIQILPGDRYPKLGFRLSSMERSVSSPRSVSNYYTIVTSRLEFRQLLPLPKPAGRSADATTWETASYGVVESHETAEKIRATLGGMLVEFENDYRSVNPPSTAPIVTLGAATPGIAGKTITYANVAEDFVPPIPSASDCCVVIQMPRKTAVGSLIRVKTGPLDMTAVNEAWGDSPYRRYQGSPELAMFQEDFKAAAEAMIISCTYRTEPPRASGLGAVRTHWFWYRARPISSAMERLERRISGHPLLSFKNAVGSCPVTLDQVR